MWLAVRSLLIKYVAPVVLQEIAGSLTTKAKAKLEAWLEKRRAKKEAKLKAQLQKLEAQKKGGE